MKVHFVVNPPSTGEFIARKLINPESKQEKLAFTLLDKFLRERFFGSGTEATITVKRIDND